MNYKEGTGNRIVATTVISRFGDRENQDSDGEISCFVIRLQDIKKGRKPEVNFIEIKKVRTS